MKSMSIAAVAVALFFAGRHLHPSHAAEQPSAAAAIEPAGPPPAPGSSAARRAQMQALLTRLAHAPAVAAPNPTIEHSTTEPADITAKRRQRVNAEIDQRAPNLPATKRTVLVAEADRLAWDKRQLRAAFLEGALSETDYVASLKDDIRASLENFEETLSTDEYVALFNRRPGGDPFTLETLVGRQPSKD